MSFTGIILLSIYLCLLFFCVWLFSLNNAVIIQHTYSCIYVSCCNSNLFKQTFSFSACEV